MAREIWIALAIILVLVATISVISVMVNHEAIGCRGSGGTWHSDNKYCCPNYCTYQLAGADPKCTPCYIK